MALADLFNLPTRGVLLQECERTANRQPGTYICTHQQSSAPKEQIISTDFSTAAYIKLLRPRNQGATDASESAAANVLPASAGLLPGRAQHGAASTQTIKRPRDNNASTTQAASALEQQDATKRRAALQPCTSGVVAGMSLLAGHAQAAAPPAQAKKTPQVTAAANREFSSSVPPSVSSAPPAAALAAAAVAARKSFTQEELKAKSIKELQEILKTRGLPVTGKKDQLILRAMEYQRRMKRAAQP